MDNHVQDLIVKSRRLTGRDPYTDRLKVRVYLRPGRHAVAGQSVHGGQKGYQDITIYRDELSKVEEKVETDNASLHAASLSHSRKQREYIAHRLTEMTGIEHAPEAIPSNPKEWNADMVKAERTFPGSLEGEFFNMVGRGILPVTKFEVVEELDAPLPEERKHANEMVNVLAEALKSQQAPQASEEVQALKMELAELRKALAGLKDKSSSSSSPRKKPGPKPKSGE